MSAAQMTAAKILQRRLNYFQQFKKSSSPTVLLGAGFSQGLGIAGTARLDALIREELSCGQDAPEFHALETRLQKRFGTRYNFEVLIAALESCSKFGAASFVPGAPPYATVFPEIAQLHADLSVEGAKRMFEIVMGIIDVEIDKEFLSLLAPKRVDAIRLFFDEIHRVWQLNVATLNYDRAVEYFVPSIYDGFEGDGDIHQFESRHFMRHDGIPRIAHFHGDLRFGITQDEMRFIKHVKPRSGNRRDLMWVERYDGVIFSGIIAGGNKAEKIILRPYSIYYA